ANRKLWEATQDETYLEELTDMSTDLITITGAESLEDAMKGLDNETLIEFLRAQGALNTADSSNEVYLAMETNIIERETTIIREVIDTDMKNDLATLNEKTDSIWDTLWGFVTGQESLVGNVIDTLVSWASEALAGLFRIPAQAMFSLIRDFLFDEVPD
ncbi:unnamed protein product, partial [marine sediment metagenome]